MDVAGKIKKLREEANLSKNQLAKKAGISQSFISAIESDQKHPGIDVMEKICHALGITLSSFFSDDVPIDRIPSDISQFAIDKNNQALIRLIQGLKEYGYSNEVISEWIQSMHTSLMELGKKYGTAHDKTTFTRNDVSPKDQKTAPKNEN
jgi:transcriptional regulator with XRE-family HTH domain